MSASRGEASVGARREHFIQPSLGRAGSQEAAWPFPQSESETLTTRETRKPDYCLFGTDFAPDNSNASVTGVPEPSGLALLLGAGLGFSAYRRWRRRAV